MSASREQRGLCGADFSSCFPTVRAAEGATLRSDATSYGTEKIPAQDAEYKCAVPGAKSTQSRRVLAEFIGTLLLTFSFGTSAQFSDVEFSGAAGALSLTGLTYTFAGVSGAHFNPAISLLLGLSGKMPWHEAISYIIAQSLAAATSGSLLLLFGIYEPLGIVPDFPELNGIDLTAEVIFTTMLCLVHAGVLYTASNNPKGDQNHFFGFAVGLVPVAATYSVGPHHLMGLNPASSAALGLSGIRHNGLFWSSWRVMAQLGAAFIAAVVLALCRPGEFGCPNLTLQNTNVPSAMIGPVFAEFTGTFFVVFAFCLGLVQHSLGTGLAVGAAYAALSYAFVDMSCHFSPAITLSVAFAGRRMLGMRFAMVYVAAQFCAALAAGAVAGVLHRIGKFSWTNQGLRAYGSYTWWAVCAAEFIFALVVAWTALVVFTKRSRHKSSSWKFMQGIAVGSALAVAEIATGGISGGIGSPAVAAGVAMEALVCHLSPKQDVPPWTNVIWYVAMQLTGSCFGTLTFALIFPEEFMSGPLVARGPDE